MTGKKTTRSVYLLASTFAVTILAGTLGILFLFEVGAFLPEQVQKPIREEPAAQAQATDANSSAKTSKQKELPRLISMLTAAVDRNDAQAVRILAQQLRNRLIENPENVDFVGKLLIDHQLSQDLRITLAWILGSLDSDSARDSLLAAIAANSGESTTLRWLIYAIGSWNKETSRKNRFDFSTDSPWVVVSPTGLRVPMARHITEEEVVSALAPFLQHNDADIRKAAITTSGNSLHFSQLRDAFRRQFSAESDSWNRANLGEALAGWARTTTGDSSQEAATIVSEILSASREPERDLLRFKVQPDLKGAPMQLSHIDTLKFLASGIDGDDFAVRQFALDILGSQTAHKENSQSGKLDKVEVQDLFLDLLKNDPHPKLRETSVLQLARISGDLSAQALTDALAEDPAWNVRYVAARELATLHSGSSAAIVRIVLKDAFLHDQDSRVRERAEESLKSKLRSN